MIDVMEEGHYLMCTFTEGGFSSERVVEFYALQGEKEHFDKDRGIGLTLTDICNLLIEQDGTYRPVSKEDLAGNGFVRCTLGPTPDPQGYRVGISDNLAYRGVQFIVPRDDVQFIGREQLVNG